MSQAAMFEKNIWAVVGATQNTTKYGYRLYQHLKHMGYKVYAVNPKYDAIDGDKCYSDLKSLPEVPEVINMVISPQKGKAVIAQAANLGIRYVWFQPGSYDDEILVLVKKLGMESVQACVLISSKI